MGADIAVIGLGATGRSVLRFCEAQGKSACAMDTREQPPGLSELRQDFPDVPIHLGALQMTWLQSAQTVVISQSIPQQSETMRQLQAKGLSCVSDIDLFTAHAQAPIIGITGSNGKSTVTTLVAELLNALGYPALAGGNLGPPALDLLHEPVPAVYVLELSSGLLAYTQHLPLVVACMLNVSPDHEDWHGGFSAYVAAKQAVYRQASIKVANRSDALCLPAQADISFALDVPDEGHWGTGKMDGHSQLCCGSQAVMPVDDMVLQGQHHVANALAACAIVAGYVKALSLDQDAKYPSHSAAHGSEPAGLTRGFRKHAQVRPGIASRAPLVTPEGCHKPVANPDALLLDDAHMATIHAVLKQFSGLPHRCQKVGEWAGVTWYNDSKGTNPGATLAALATVRGQTQGQVFVLLGGDSKGADFSPLAAQLSAGQVVLFGRDAGCIAKAWQTPVVQVTTLHQAVAVASQSARAGDAVLLSPACASWDQFTDYAARGRVFETLLREAHA